VGLGEVAILLERSGVTEKRDWEIRTLFPSLRYRKTFSYQNYNFPTARMGGLAADVYA
jgi:hypothetical protein